MIYDTIVHYYYYGDRYRCDNGGRRGPMYYNVAFARLITNETITLVRCATHIRQIIYLPYIIIPYPGLRTRGITGNGQFFSFAVILYVLFHNLRVSH